jgi:hypothetical protein
MLSAVAAGALLRLQGEYDVQIIARDTANNELMCVVVHFEMVLPPSRRRLLWG